MQQLLLCNALLLRIELAPAADQLTSVPGAHGPLMMLYLRQPLGVAGASRVYGLRLQQQSQPQLQPGSLAGAMPAALPRQHDIVDLQIRRYADVRVEFGQRMTWNLGRREFGLSASQSSMAIRLPGPAPATPMVARAPP